MGSEMCIRDRRCSNCAQLTFLVNFLLQNKMGNWELALWWACTAATEEYRPQALSPEDARRAPAIRSAKALLDWRVSRALLQSVRTAGATPQALSLSHSGGHALCAQAPADRAVGADLERIRPRDIHALAAWVCSAAEQAWLRDAASLPLRQTRFYLLWTCLLYTSPSPRDS